MAFLSNDPVTTLFLITKGKVSENVKYLPEWLVESHRVDDVGVLCQVEKFLARNRVPNFASSIVGASDEFVSSLVESTVGKWQQVSSKGLKA